MKFLHWGRGEAWAIRILGGIALGAMPSIVLAQDNGAKDVPKTIDASQVQGHAVRISPNVLVLDDATRSATVKLSNPGNKPVETSIVVEYAFPHWGPNDPEHPADLHFPNVRDTLIEHLGPGDRFVGPWISGLPTQLTLAPKESRTVTLRVTPPAEAPSGEYYARIATVVRPRTRQKPPPSKDAKTIYTLPVRGMELPSARDSLLLYYRHGTPKMGLKIVGVTTGIGKHARDTSVSQSWVHVKLHLEGNAHFEGVFRHYYITPAGDTAMTMQPFWFTLHRDAEIHHWCEGPTTLPSGKYDLLIVFDPSQSTLPDGKQLPMQPVSIRVPVEL